MPQHASTPDLLQRLDAVETQLAQLRRTGWERDELPIYPTYVTTIAYSDATTMTTSWECVFAPRTGRLSLGLVFIGDQVVSTNTGGTWQVVLNGNVVVMSGSVLPTYTYQFAAADVDLAPYGTLSALKLEIQTRRTSGATTGGKFSAGGSIGIAPRYARLL